MNDDVAPTAPRQHLTLFAPDYHTVRVIGCSPPSWAIHMTLVDRNIPHQVRWLDFERGAHRTQAMRTLNPRGTVPILTTRGAPLTETLAILLYLDRHWPPATAAPGEEDDALALNRLVESDNLKRAGMAALIQVMKDPTGKTGQTEFSALGTELMYWEAYMEQAGGGALSGPTLGVCDWLVFAYLATAIHLELPLPSTPCLREFHARMLLRPAVRATWPAPWGTPLCAPET